MPKRARGSTPSAPADELTGADARAVGHYIEPVPGGDLIRSPEVLPTGATSTRSTRSACRPPLRCRRREAGRSLLEPMPDMPRSVALVLWGSDNIKSDGGPISQALALMGAKPRFDGFGRLAAPT
jgi:magnesium chelatase subunit H